MNANISTDELRLLAYLHEHATGYTEQFRFEPQEVCTALEITEEQIKKDTSYLASHGLAGMQVVDFGTRRSPHAFELNSIWLTGDGENYMREIEVQVEKEEPGMFKKIGVKAVEVGEKIVMAIAVKVLTDKLSGH